MRYGCKIAPHVVIIFLVSLLVAACSSSPQEKIDKMAADMKAELPKVLDSDTKLMNVYTRHLELVSEYELLHNMPTEPGDVGIAVKMKTYLKNQVCPAIKKELLDDGISSRYIYKTKNGEIILDLVLSPGDC